MIKSVCSHSHSRAQVVDEANKPRELDDSKRRTKVVASLGPSSWSDEMIQKMILAWTPRAVAAFKTQMPLKGTSTQRGQKVF